MNITRRSLMLGAAATVPLVSTIRYAGAQAAEFNYKYANNLPLTAFDVPDQALPVKLPSVSMLEVT